MNKHISFILMLTILFTCFSVGGATAEAGKKYRDLNDDFFSEADLMEEEPNNTYDDADGLENAKWTGALLTANEKGEDWDFYYAQLRAGRYYSLQLHLKNASLNVGNIGFGLTMKDKNDEKKSSTLRMKSTMFLNSRHPCLTKTMLPR